MELTESRLLDLSEVVVEGAGTFVGFALAQDPPTVEGTAFFHEHHSEAGIPPVRAIPLSLEEATITPEVRSASESTSCRRPS